LSDHHIRRRKTPAYVGDLLFGFHPHHLPATSPGRRTNLNLPGSASHISVQDSSIRNKWATSLARICESRRGLLCRHRRHGIKQIPPASPFLQAALT
jgi:hypothetical protein